MIGLEFICKNKEIQYKDLAKQLGITKQSITNWTNGSRKIPDKHLERLKDILKIPKELIQKEVADDEDRYVLWMLMENEDNEKVVDEKYIDTIVLEQSAIDEIKYQCETLGYEDARNYVDIVILLTQILKKKSVRFDIVYRTLLALEAINENFKNEIIKLTQIDAYTNMIKLLAEQEQFMQDYYSKTQKILKENNLLK